jgi:hypothetical protein
MFWPSWDHHQAVYIINTIKLIEIAIWIHIVVRLYYKVVKVVENCTLCYDDNYNTEKSWSIQECVFKILVEVIKVCCILRI